MEEKVKRIFFKNQKSYMVISVIFYIFNLFHYSVAFNFYGLDILSIKVNPYFDSLIVLILIVTAFFSFAITSIYSFPFNLLLGKSRYYGFFLKIATVILLGVAINKRALFQNYIYIYFMDALFVLIAVIDCIITNRSFVKAQNRNVSNEILMTKINEDEYKDYITRWVDTLKLLVISSSAAGVITAKNLCLDIRIINPILVLLVIYNWIKFYDRYKDIVIDNKICTASVMWLIGVIIFSVIDIYVFGTKFFSSLEYFALYTVSIIILYSSINKVNFEMVKYKYSHNIGNNLFKADQMKRW